MVGKSEEMCSGYKLKVLKSVLGKNSTLISIIMLTTRCSDVQDSIIYLIVNSFIETVAGKPSSNKTNFISFKLNLLHSIWFGTLVSTNA